MSLPSNALYIQFHPLVYLLKLYIEINISDLIVKIVKAENQLNEYGSQSGNMHILPGPSTNAGVSSPVQRQLSFHNIPMEIPEVDNNDGGKMVAVQTIFDRASGLEKGLGNRAYDDDDDYHGAIRSTLGKVMTAETRSSEGDMEAESSSMTGLRGAVT